VLNPGAPRNIDRSNSSFALGMILYDGRGSFCFADVGENGVPASLLAVEQLNQS
jgi:hypothetical protein